MASKTVLFLSTILTLTSRVSLQNTPSVNCNSLPQVNYPFCNSKLSHMERTNDLISRLTNEELYQQCMANANAIPRLGIKDYNWRSNCLHGWALSGGKWPQGITWTVFPTPLGLGATFNDELVKKVAMVTADEGRALHNIMLKVYNGSSTEAAGLNCFSPMINLFRDPRWGRGKETFSEDPYHLSLMGVAYTRGLQEGEDTRYLKVAACAKHYAVHSGPGDIRNGFIANVTLHDLYDTFLPAFKSQAMAANVAQIMTALSGVRIIHQQKEGAPDSANPFLLKSIFRNEFSRPFVSTISDNGAIPQVYTVHHYVDSKEMAAAVCMNASTDLDLIYDSVYSYYLPQAVEAGLVSLDVVKDAVLRSFYLRIRLGDFDSYESVPYQRIDASHLDTIENQQLNLQSVRESIVLLKNTKNVLPLDSDKVSNIAVIGPLANATDELLANYIGIPSKIVSVLSGLQSYDNSISYSYSPGCLSTSCPNMTGFDQAMNMVISKSIDVVIAVMGLDDSLEGEGHDRKDTKCLDETIDVLTLPGCQNHLLQSLMKAHSNIILVLINGGPLSIPDIYTSDKVPAIIETFYGGSLAGEGLADVIFGRYNPSGRMPVTTLMSSRDLRDSVDYNMSSQPGRTYRYFNGQTLFPFGYGLSYTTFKYSDLKILNLQVKPCENNNITVTVTNTGSMAGSEVVQAYLLPPKINGVNPPLQELVAYTRVQIDPSKSTTVQLTLSAYMMSLVNEKGQRYIYPGNYTISVGGSPPGDSLAVKAQDNLLGTFMIVTSTPVLVDQCGLLCMGC